MGLHTLHNFLAKFTSRQRSYVLSGPFGFVPAEILDLVISHLANDKAALMQCALVHPTWTRVSRHHLAPLTLAVSSRSHAKELTNVLNSPRETLSLSITGITLIGNAPFYDISTNDKSSRVRLYTKLLQLLKAKNIMLRSGMVVNDPSLVGIFARYFSDLTEFKVIFAFYQDIVSFMRALCDSFPRLTGLSIELGTDGMDFPDAPLPGLCDLRLSAPCLRSLRVVGWNNALVRWLGDNIVGTLEQLELQSMSLRSTCRIQESVGLIQGTRRS
ncbi:hypothetical protein BDZ89DRAFT_539437 [Hymenopellis radicata]|nr:hypothetical protein BDZ89DRAFT_539437 [Hymenopellis radicata]